MVPLDFRPQHRPNCQLRSRRRSATRALALAALPLLAFAGAGCGLLGDGGSQSTISTSAVFSDVADLVPGAPVQLADITVGHVTSITLDGNSAKVVMSIDRSAGVPASVSAEIRQATILGEEVVELVPGAGTASATSGGSSQRQTGVALLADGATIRRTEVVPGVEQLVRAGTAVIGSISTSQLAGLVQAGGEGFGGQGPTLRRLLADLNSVTGAYASRDQEITALVADLHQLGSSLAPDATANATAIGNLARATTVLAKQSGRFETLMAALDHLAVGGRGILENYLPGIDLQLEGLDRVSSALAQRQTDLGLLLEYLPGHNATLHDLTVNRFAQIVNDLIVCGIPNGGGNTSQAASTCNPGGG